MFYRYFIYCLALHWENNHPLAYEVIQEGENVTLNYSWPEGNKLEVSWFKDSTLISRCDSSFSCTDFISSYSKTIVRRSNFTEVVDISIHIPFATRLSSGLWRLQNTGLKRNTILKSFALQVFANGDAIECINKTNDCNFTVVCSLQRVYPQAECRASVRLNERECFSGNSNLATNSEMVRETTYFESNCTIAMAYIIFRPSVVDVDVSMYPNVTGKEDDAKLGLQKSFRLQLDNVNKGSLTCARLRPADRRLICKASRLEPDAEETMSTKTSHAQNNVTVATPKDEPPSFSCEHEVHQNVIINCSATSKYQLQDCIFYIAAEEGNELIKKVGNIIATRDSSLKEASRIQQCSIEIPLERIGNDIYDVEVRMLFNTSGGNIISEGRFVVVIDLAKLEQADGSNQFNIIIVIVPIITIFLLLLGILLFKHLHRKQTSQNPRVRKYSRRRYGDTVLNREGSREDSMYATIDEDL
ncbi:hypothetical protein Bpfe_003565 [Biomphalaria pfeifferi]|uniref:Uncharacterized protein n=1 Tax=Biomphalaria pfeifferi TaxID=112525 RepID=A0AAD8FJP6_BIOPF|nr:hypothetical protein Bpfe_003565 [Biomphalaria pfeifferi]